MSLRNRSHHPRLALRAVPLLALAACGSGSEPTHPGAPPGPPASIRVVSGAGQADTAMAMLRDPIVAEVRDSAGRPVRAARVLFSSVPVSDAARPTATGVSLCEVGSTRPCELYQRSYADSAIAGRASAGVRLGTYAGAVRLRVSVAGTELADTVSLTARPAAAASLVMAPSDSTAYVGSSYRVAGRVLDQYGNGRPGDPVTFAASGAAATVSADGVFHAQAIGRAFAIARSGAVVDTAWITVPPCGTIAALEPSAPGGARVVKVELDGSGLRRLAPVHDTYYGTEPDWISPSAIAFDDGGYNAERILVVDTLGVITRLTAPGTPTFAEGHAAGGPGGVVYFDAWGAADYGTALWKVSAPGGMPVRIGPNPPGNANAWQATVAPDGQRLAYVDVNRGGLSLLDVETGAMTPLRIAAATPRWSPTGDWIVFGAGGTLHLVHPDGTGLSDVAGARPFAPRADWSPDGEWLITRSATRLELINVKTGTILPLGWASGFIRPAFRRE
jgi:hypothetical protein